MTLRIKKLFADVKVPSYAYAHDAGMDVFSREDATLRPGERHIFHLGFSAEMPEGVVALAWDKGGRAAKDGLHTLAGVIDAGYRGEWVVILLNVSDVPVSIKNGEKLCQILIQPVLQPTIEVADELSETQRGAGKFGSSGTT
jgi:dUTP pyrophosphatase